MDWSLIPLTTCPYCPAGQGMAYTDVFAITESPAAGSAADPQETPFVRFEPHHAPHGPCPHLVHLEAETWRRAAERDERDGGPLGYNAFSYRHPTLAAADPNRKLVGYMWEALSARGVATVRPATPFQFVQEDYESTVSYPRCHELHGQQCGECWATADGLYALDAPRFIRECMELSGAAESGRIARE